MGIASQAIMACGQVSMRLVAMPLLHMPTMADGDRLSG